jgi:hypothetical protein
MGGARKGVATRHVLSFGLAAAGSAADLVGATFLYDPFARGGATASGSGVGYDVAAEEVQELALTTNAVLTGQSTNFVSPRVTHRNAAGTTKNQISVAFSAAGVVTAAFVPVNLRVASGAVTTGAGTGVLTVTTGTALPWTLVAGDTITFDRLSNNATGLATPAMSLTFLIANMGS